MVLVITSLFLFFFFLEAFTEWVLNEANLRHVSRHLSVGAIPKWLQGKITPALYQRSLEYTFAKGKVQRWGMLYGGIVTLVVLFGDVLPFLDDGARRAAPWVSADGLFAGILFCLATGILLGLLHLPLDAYRTFVLEERFGFNKTRPALYAIDKVKALMVSIGLGVPLLGAVLWLMDKAGSYWWLWAFGVILGFELLTMVIYPKFIAPLFNRFEPLKEGELRERILALAEQTGFRVADIYVMDGSRRSAHSNAYFTGIGKAKRIVFFDTLIGQLTLDQGMAVLAHEIGHYQMKHIRRMLLIGAVILFFSLYVLSWLIDYPPLFHAFGLSGPSHAGALVLFALLSGPFSFYLNPLLHFVSRKHEYEADRYAARTLEDPQPMIEALVQLTIENLANPEPHPWYSAYHYTHPTVGERIQALERAAVPAS